MKIAILILGHKLPHQMARLVKRLDDVRFDIFIHIDAKVPIEPFKESVSGCCSISTIYFVEDRIKTYFFDYSLVEATCKCADLAVRTGKYKYFILLTGQDFPIKSNDFIYNKLMASYPMCWIDMYDVEEASKHGVKWVNKIGFSYTSQRARRGLLSLVGSKFYFSPSGKIVKLFAVIYDKIQTICSYVPRNELKKLSYKYSAGSHFWMLPDIAVTHILNNFKKDKALTKIFRHIAAPEESYFQTSLSAMEGLLLPDEFIQFSSPQNEMDNPSLRLIKWYEHGIKTDGHPAIWKLEDLSFIMQSKSLFARKFDETVDSGIIDQFERGYKYVDS